MKKETRAYSLTSGYGHFARRDEVVVECVEQRGKFYASMNSLNASAIGVGDTSDEAFADWAKKCKAAPKQAAEVANGAAEPHSG